MKNVLLVGISAPPKSGAESIQFSKLIKAFNELDYALSLITTDVPNRGWHSEDPTLKTANQYIQETILLNDLSNTVLKRFISYLPKRWRIPDDHFAITFQVDRILKRIRERPQLIYGRGMPFSSAVLASKIAKRINVPLVLHLSDPFTLNPYLNFSNLDKMKDMERECFDVANIVGFTTRQTALLYSEQYPEFAAKFRIYPNVYDPIDINLSERLPSLFTIRYTGNVYGGRTPFYLLESLKQVGNKFPQFKNDSQFIITGQIEEKALNQLLSSPLEIVRIEQAKSYESTKRDQCMSHILVSVDKPMVDERDLVFLPSKLLDYMCSKRTILNISSEGSASEEFVKGYQLGKSFDFNDSVGMASFLEKKYLAFCEGRLGDFTRDSIPIELSNKAVLVRMLKDVSRS